MRVRAASTDRDWSFVRLHSPLVDDYSREWLAAHAGRDAWVVVLEQDGELEGFFVYQVFDGKLWIVFLYCRPGFGARHQQTLARILSSVAEQCGVASIGMRTVRPGFARVLERLGLRATSKVYTEFQFPLLAGEEAPYGRRRQAIDHDGAAAAPAAAG